MVGWGSGDMNHAWRLLVTVFLVTWLMIHSTCIEFEQKSSLNLYLTSKAADQSAECLMWESFQINVFNDQERPITSMNSNAQVQTSKARNLYSIMIYTKTYITSQETSILQANLPKLNSTDQIFKSKGR